MKKYHYYLFDFDGTIMNSFETIYKIFSYAYQKIGVTINKGEIVYLSRIPVLKTYEYLVGDQDKRKMEIVGKALYEIIQDQSIYESSFLFDDVKETFSTILAHGGKIGIISNNESNSIKSELKRFDIDPTNIIVIGNDETDKKKPDAEPILNALKAWHYEGDKKDVAMIGDALIDVQCGKNAKTDYYLLERFNEYPNYQEQKIKTLMELVDYD